MTILNIGNPFPNPDQVFLHLKISYYLKHGINVINLSSNQSNNILSIYSHDLDSGKIILANYKSWSSTNIIKFFSILLKLPIGTLINISREIFRDVKSYRLFLNLLKSNLILISYSNKADVLHFDWINQAVIFLPALKIIDKPIVVSIRGKAIAVQPLVENQLQEQYQKLFSKATIIHSISKGLLKHLVNYSVPDYKIRIIQPAVEYSRYRTLWAGNSDNPKTITIVTVAHLVWKKNIMSAIKVIGELHKEGYDIKYKVIGEGVERQALTFAINDLNLAEIVLLYGFLPHYRVIEELITSEIFLIPSVQEGFCNSVIEAQAVGLPVVASNAEGLDENIEHCMTGLIFDRWKDDELKSALKYLLNNPNERKRMGKNGKERVKEKFDIEDQVRNFEQMYKELIEKT